MDYFKSRKLKNRFQNVESHEPEDQLVLYQGGNCHRILPPLTKLGGAKTQESIRATAAAAATKPAPAPRLTQRYYQQRRSCNEDPDSVSLSQRFKEWSRCATATQRPESTYYQAQPEKRPRPASVDTIASGFVQPFKLPPINEACNRGPLPNKNKQKSSKKNRLSARSKKNRDNGATSYCGGDGDGYKSRKRPETPYVKEGPLARRFAQPDKNMGIRPSDDSFTRLDKMRSTLQMFDQSAPVYRRSTDIVGTYSANNGAMQSCRQAYLQPNSKPDYDRRPPPPPMHNYRERGEIANQYEYRVPPSGMTVRERFAAMADTMEIQVKGQKKSDMVDNSYYNVSRAREKFSKRVYGNTFPEDVEMLEAILEDEMD